MGSIEAEHRNDILRYAKDHIASLDVESVSSK